MEVRSVDLQIGQAVLELVHGILLRRRLMMLVLLLLLLLLLLLVLLVVLELLWVVMEVRL